MTRLSIRSRFKDAPWFPQEPINVIIGGAGGIGSWLTLLISRAGFEPVIYDYDRVEEHNIGGQLFGKEHIDSTKVEALKDVVYRFADQHITIFEEKFTADSMGHIYMFSAFDNMKARKDMFEVWYEANKDNPDAIFIDGRLLMEQLQIFCVTPDNALEYKSEHLFDDSEVEDENCTMKQTSHSAAIIAGLMVGFFTNHITNVNEKSKVRHTPFLHEYFIPINLTS